MDKQPPSDPTHRSSIEESLWDFPMDYVLKVMGSASDPIEKIVNDIITSHIPSFDPSKNTIRPSKAGRFIALSCYFLLENKEQVEGIYSELNKRSEIKMAL